MMELTVLKSPALAPLCCLEPTGPASPTTLRLQPLQTVFLSLGPGLSPWVTLPIAAVGSLVPRAVRNNLIFS